MQRDLYVLPVKRYGNESAPKLVVLLCNPGDDPTKYERLPDYTMYLDNKYKDSGTSLDVAQTYNAWWDDVFNIFKETNFNPDDVLVLEYYPYHTASMSDIPNKSYWTEYAIKALAENKELLYKSIKNNIPVFGYYYSYWINEVPELKHYKKFYKSKTRWKSQKIKELSEFLQNN